jgi:hypothetical protein
MPFFATRVAKLVSHVKEHDSVHVASKSNLLFQFVHDLQLHGIYRQYITAQYYGDGYFFPTWMAK